MLLPLPVSEHSYSDMLNFPTISEIQNSISQYKYNVGKNSYHFK